jgi:hypothetical protein
MARVRQRQRVRDCGYLLFDTNTSLGWRSIQRTSFAHGEEKVAQRQWRRVNDEHGRHVGYQAMHHAPSFSNGDALLAIPSSMASISMREMHANAGLMGRSATASLSDDARERHFNRRRLVPEFEDFVERAIAKVQEFGATRLVCS